MKFRITIDVEAEDLADAWAKLHLAPLSLDREESTRAIRMGFQRLNIQPEDDRLGGSLDWSPWPKVEDDKVSGRLPLISEDPYVGVPGYLPEIPQA